TGESTLVTVSVGTQKVVAKGDRHMAVDEDAVVGLMIDPAHTPINKLSQCRKNAKIFLLSTSAPQHLSNQYNGLFYFLEIH
ncbi:MAG: hypothetical protein AAF316_12035, partial [Cyanobacteria bacterium P01_A01_bin.80]